MLPGVQGSLNDGLATTILSVIRRSYHATAGRHAGEFLGRLGSQQSKSVFGFPLFDRNNVNRL